MSAKSIKTWFQGHRITASSPALCMRVRDRLEIETTIDIGEVLRRARTITATDFQVINQEH